MTDTGLKYPRMNADLAAKLVELNAALIPIGQPTSLSNADNTYRALLAELLQHQSTTLIEDTFIWMPSAVRRAYELVFGPPPPKATKQAAYWDGAKFERRDWPEAEHVLSDNYADLAEKIIRFIDPSEQNVTIVDLGGATGALEFHLAIQRPGLRFIVIDREALSLGFGVEFAKRHNIDFVPVWAEIGQVIEAPPNRQRLTELIKSVPGRVILVSRGGFGLSSIEKYEALFNYFIDEVGADIGVHYEICGLKTETFKKVDKLYTVKVTDRQEDLPDAFAMLEARVDIEISERIEIYPHYQNLRFLGLSHWPSYLSWTARER